MFDLFISGFNVILHQPLFNALILLYQYLPGHDFGIAVIVLTFLIKLMLYPLGAQGIRSQKALSELQPKIKEIQQKFKNNKEQQTRATLELYKKEKINPFSSLLPLLVQLPILLALFRVFWKGFGQDQLAWLYSFVSPPGQIDMVFLSIVNLAQASIILAVLNGIAQFVQVKMMTPRHGSGQAPAQKGPDFSSMMQKQMLYFFPLFTVFILWRMPSAIALYWMTTTLFTIGQQYIMMRKQKNVSNQLGKNQKNSPGILQENRPGNDH